MEREVVNGVSSVGSEHVRTTPQVLRVLSVTYPEDIAIVVDGGEAVTYSQLEERSNAVARGLVEHDIQPGERVGIRFDNARRIESMVAYFAIHKAGATVVILQSGGDPVEGIKLLRHSEATTLICPTDLALKDTAAWTVSLQELEYGQSTESFNSLARPDGIGEINYTSGTTGTPKGNACTQNYITFFCRYYPKPSYPNEAKFRDQRPKNILQDPLDGNVFLQMLRPFYARPKSRQLELNIVMRAFEPGRYCSLIEEHQIHSTWLSPPQALSILNSGATRRYDVSSMLAIRLGGARTPAKLISRLRHEFPRSVFVISYTTCESPIPVTSVFDRSAQPYTPGLLGKPSTFMDATGQIVARPEIRISDELGNGVSPGHSGEIWVRCPGLPYRWYFRDPERTAQVFLENGWIRTGDLGFKDEANNLHILDRVHDNIIRGTQSIATPEIEDVLCEHESVAEAAVFAIPDDALGEEVAAAVVLRSQATVHELQQFVRERLDAYKVPRRIVFLDHFPYNARGKVLKRRIRGQIGC